MAQNLLVMHLSLLGGYTAIYSALRTPRKSKRKSRASRTINTMIAQFCETQHTTGTNTSPSEATGCPPAYLNQVRQPNVPQTLYTKITPPKDTAKFLNELRSTIFGISDQQRYYNLLRRSWKVSDLVLVNVAEKFTPKNRGPYGIKNFIQKLQTIN